MGASERTIGGSGGTKRLGRNFVDWLSGALSGGGVGGGSQQGLAGIFNQYLNADFNDPNSSALLQLGARQKASTIGDLRSRYTLAGTGYGSPAAVAEGNYSAGFDPALVAQIGGQKLQAAMNLLQVLQGTASKGLTQAQTVMQSGALSDILGVLGTGTDIAGLFSGGGFANLFKKGGLKLPALGTPDVQTPGDYA